MRNRFLRFLVSTSALAIGLTAASAQSPVGRSSAVAGSIIAAKGGEELRFVREERWRAAELKQDLAGGDTLRTNAIGNLAILFSDRTQIRVGRNSTLTVNDVATPEKGTTQLDLQSGNLWARAARGGTGVDVKTPAAVAAIRGTDWSLAVDGSGKTALVVLEGVVELKNAQGTVTVRQGEGAVASIGQAPTKFVLVNSDDREQMLFYLTLRDAFTSFSLSPLEGPALRAERARIEAIAPERRRAEDWLSLAEIASYFDGRALAVQALAETRRFSLSGTQRARAELVEGALAAGQRRWKEAAAHFARAGQGGLDAKRRISAAYGHYIAQSLADPKRVQPEPKLNSNDPEAVLARAYVVAFREGLPAAQKIMKEAEKRFPRNARVAVFAAQLAMALNQREDMRKSVDRAISIDADDPNVILTDATIRADIDGQVDKAIADLRRAVAIAPGNTDLWNNIGLFESTKDRPLAAEDAFRRAIAEDPESPVAYANLAILLLDQSRVDEAGALIERALSIDPSFSVGYIALGRYLLQKGESAKGLEAILAGSTANPAYSQGLLLTAIAYYQSGDVDLAEQALDNADRLDPNDPTVSIVRTAIALDQYRADEAIISAREAMRRYRQRGGDFAGIAVNRQAGSYPAQAYRFLNLDEWARYYGDRVFDPFTGSSYFDQAAARRPSIFATRPTISSAQGNDIDLTTYTLTIQGLFLDPLAISGRVGRTDLLRRPFIDTEFGGSLLVRNNRVGWQADASVQGFSNEPVPTSFSLAAGRALVDPRSSLDREDASNASFFVGMAPTAADRFLIFGAASKIEPGLLKVDNTTRFFTGTQELTSMQAGAGWSHSFGDRNVLTGAVYAIRGIDQRYSKVASADLFPFIIAGEQWARNRTEGAMAALNHSVGFGDFTLRYGVEGQKGRTFGHVLGNVLIYNYQTYDLDTDDVDDRTKATFQAARAYADAFWRPSDRFEIQVGVEGDFLDVGHRRSENTAAPRIGIGLSPFDGQWLRAAYRRDGVLPVSFTLSPVTTVGLSPNILPVSLGGRTDTMTLRWDAEWTPQLFTAVEYQRQDVRGLEIPVANTFDTISIDRGRIERLAATANLWLGYGFGVFGTVGMLSSDVRSGDSFGADIPFVSGRFARTGITFAHPSRLKFAVAATFVGDRKGNLDGLKLDDYWTADANITWETPDRRMLFGLTFLNLFNQRYELAPDVAGTGRTFAATVKARF